MVQFSILLLLRDLIHLSWANGKTAGNLRVNQETLSLLPRQEASQLWTDGDMV